MKANETQDAGAFSITGKQAKVLAALVGGSTIAAAAKSCAVNPATVHDWLKTPGFDAAYRAARRAVVGQASAALQASCHHAVVTLVKVAGDATAPASSRVSAARAILEMGFKAVELEDLAARIEALEGLAL
jgi:transposase-like protein